MNTFITNLQEIRKKIKLQKAFKKASKIYFKKNNTLLTKNQHTKILFSAILILGLNFNVYGADIANLS